MKRPVLSPQVLQGCGALLAGSGGTAWQDWPAWGEGRVLGPVWGFARGVPVLCPTQGLTFRLFHAGLSQWVWDPPQITAVPGQRFGTLIEPEAS